MRAVRGFPDRDEPSTRLRGRARVRQTKETFGSENPARLERQETSAESTLPESSPFEMKPRTGLLARRRLYEEMSRVDTRTTAGPSGVRASCLATSKPSSSGSWISSSTTWGQSRAAAAIADSASTASPTTLKPSASNRARANDRNPGWSSTISTVSGTRIWLHAAGAGASGLSLGRFRPHSVPAHGRPQVGHTCCGY